MLLYLLILVIGFWLGIKIDKKEDRIGKLFFGALGICLALLFLVVPTAIFSSFLFTTHQQYTEYDRVEIVALSNSESVQGTFFLLSGRIESVPYYFFYYQLPDGGKKLGKALAENAAIYEEKREGAFMVKTGSKTTYGKTKKWIHWLLYPEFLSPAPSTGFSNYAIHVPKGTIKQEINLDLKNIK